MSTQVSRRVFLNVIYQGADISKDISPYLIDFTYTDNAHGKDDDISLTLEDRQGLWRGDWFPTRGDSISVSITSINWDGPDDVRVLPCGTFQVDEIECFGPPTVATIKAVSTPVSSAAKRRKETKAWEAVSLSVIAGEISSKHGLSLFWDAANDPFYERKDQIEVPDLVFLKGLCIDAGLAIKTTDNQLVVYSEDVYDKKAPVDEICFGQKRISTYRLRAKTAGINKAARVQYHDSQKDETYEAYVSGSLEFNEVEEVLEINQKVGSHAEAEGIAKKRLYEANKTERSGTISLMGHFAYVGGCTVALSGWGAFDGLYFVERAVHCVDKGGGYTTSLDIRIGG